MAYDQGDITQATALGGEGLVLCRQAGDKSGIAWSLLILAEVALYPDHFTRAEALGEESLALFREVEDRRGTAFALHVLGAAVSCERAVALMEESLARSRSAGYRWLSGLILNNL